MNFKKGTQVPPSETELVQRAQQGDAKAVGELYTRHHEQIYRYIWSKTGNAALAEDLTGDVFMRMVSRISTFQFQGIPFQAWLYRIARNLLVDHIRKEASKSFVSLDDAGMLPETELNLSAIVESRLTFEHVQEALKAIDVEQAEVIRLRFLVGLSVKEVADRLEKSIAAVKALQHRGLVALRGSLHY